MSADESLADVLTTIRDARRSIFMYTAASVLLGVPELRTMFVDKLGASGGAQVFMLKSGGMVSGPGIDEAFADLTPADTLRQMGGQVSLALLPVGDALARLQKQNEEAWSRPVAQLVRHMRNAVAHSGSFHFRDPKRFMPSACGEITLTLADDGRALMGDFIYPGDVLVVLDGLQVELTT